MEVTDAPSRAVSGLVLFGGLVTTALALALSSFLSGLFQTSILLFTLWYVLPVGASLVGMVAGTGYAGVSWLRGVRITWATMAAIAGVAALTFVASQVVDYAVQLNSGRAMPAFGAWFDQSTRSISFVNDDGRSATGPVGMLGYGVMIAVMAGFVGGSLTLPGILRAKHYCAACGQYMRTKHVGTLPASVKSRIMLAKSAETKVAYEAEQATAREQGMAVHDHLFTLAQGDDPAAFAETARLVDAGTKPATKLPTRLRVDLAACPSCRAGVLTSQTVTGQGRQQKVEKLAQSPVASANVRALHG